MAMGNCSGSNERSVFRASWANSSSSFTLKRSPLVLFGLEGELGLHFAGEKTIFVSFLEYVVQHGLQVGPLVTVSGKIAGVEGFGVDDLKEEIAGKFLLPEYPWEYHARWAGILRTSPP